MLSIVLRKVIHRPKRGVARRFHLMLCPTQDTWLVCFSEHPFKGRKICYSPLQSFLLPLLQCALFSCLSLLLLYVRA